MRANFNRLKQTEMGVDVEFFVMGAKTKALIIPPSTEELRKSATSNLVERDNCTIEVQTEPIRCCDFVTGGVARARYMAQTAAAVVRGRLSLSPAVKLTDTQLEDEAVHEFGCSPSMSLDPNGDPHQLDMLNYKSPYRSAGFHIHLSTDNDERWVKDPETLKEADTRIIALADGLLGLPSVVLEAQNWRKQARWRRRELCYGMAGEFRHTKYSMETYYWGDRIVQNKIWIWRTGLEYRVLSPWVCMDPRWVWWALSSFRCCWDLVTSESDAADRVLNDFPERMDIMNAINGCNPVKAAELWTVCRQALDKHTEDWLEDNHAFSRHSFRLLEFYMVHGATKVCRYTDIDSRWSRWRDNVGQSFPDSSAPRTFEYVDEENNVANGRAELK